MTRAAILAFHAIEEGPAPLCIPPAMFERQIGALADVGAVAFTVDELVQALVSGADLPDRAVAFTFDDGYESVHRSALPVLSAHGYRATVLPVTGRLGATSDWSQVAGSSLRILSATQLTELRATGWEVGGHTHTHRALTRLSEREVAEELATSSAYLEDLLGARVRSFAYPYGAVDASSRRIAAAEYRSCLGIGAALVNRRTSPELLERVDAWYVRRPWQIRRLHDPVGRTYLGLRRLGREVGSWRPSARFGQ